MRVPTTEPANPLSMYDGVQPSETSLAMAGATMNQLEQSKQKRNAAASSGIPGPGSTTAKRSRLKAP